MTDERFEEIIKDKTKCEFCVDEDKDTCFCCEKVTSISAVELKEFWQKIKTINDFSNSQLAKVLTELQKYKQAEAERENPQPLTLEELRQMEGEPVWVEESGRSSHRYECKKSWQIISLKEEKIHFHSDVLSIRKFDYTNVFENGDLLAYRYKPKEAE